MPFSEVSDNNGDIRQDVEISLFESGNAKYLTAIRSKTPGHIVKTTGPEAGSISGAVTSDSSSLINIKIPEPAFVYDIRNKKFIGKTDKFTTNLLPSQANIFALLPSKLENINLEINKQRYKKGENLVFKVGLPVEFRDSGICLRIEIYGPDGNLIPYYTQKIVTKNGFINGEIPFALDEIKGKYKIKVIDIATGFNFTKEFEII